VRRLSIMIPRYFVSLKTKTVTPFNLIRRHKRREIRVDLFSFILINRFLHRASTNSPAQNRFLSKTVAVA